MVDGKLATPSIYRHGGELLSMFYNLGYGSQKSRVHAAFCVGRNCFAIRWFWLSYQRGVQRVDQILHIANFLEKLVFWISNSNSVLF
jgi:hypothetical protein